MKILSNMDICKKTMKTLSPELERSLLHFTRTLKQWIGWDIQTMRLVILWLLVPQSHLGSDSQITGLAGGPLLWRVHTKKKHPFLDIPPGKDRWRSPLPCMSWFIIAPYKSPPLGVAPSTFTRVYAKPIWSQRLHKQTPQTQGAVSYGKIPKTPWKWLGGQTV